MYRISPFTIEDKIKEEIHMVKTENIPPYLKKMPDGATEDMSKEKTE